jgi:uncharacterized protein (TIGR02246 family)
LVFEHLRVVGWFHLITTCSKIRAADVTGIMDCPNHGERAMDRESDPASITSRFEAAWNAHDMDAFAALFHPDATFVNRFGTYWRGVGPIVSAHRAIHETVYKDSTVTIDTPDVDVISEDAVILHFWARLMTGAAHPAGPHQIDTLLLAVVTRRDGIWRIQAAENVTLADPRTGAAVLRDR